MRKIKLSVLLFFTLTTVGCTNLLNHYVETINPHEPRPFERPEIEQISVTGREEFKDLILELIVAHETEAQILYHNYDGEDVQAQVSLVSDEILHDHPLGAYAIYSITASATRLVSYFEVDVEIVFSRSHEEIDSIVDITSERGLINQLLISMSEHRESTVIRSRMQITFEEIAELVGDIYYQNPRRIIMLPFITVETFPEDGIDKIHEIQFGYAESPRMMRVLGETLAEYVSENAARAVGDTDAEMLLALTEYLIATTTYDELTARSFFEHGARHFAATAFGALVRGSAAGEGFAMAFKALCDELGIENRIVLGYLDGHIHAWNIVYLDGDFYHIDVAMATANGLETAFLKTDADFEELLYEWDRENTARAEGALTLEDIRGLTEDPDDTEEPDDTEGQDNSGVPEAPGYRLPENEEEN